MQLTVFLEIPRIYRFAFLLLLVYVTSCVTDAKWEVPSAFCRLYKATDQPRLDLMFFYEHLQS